MSLKELNDDSFFWEINFLIDYLCECKICEANQPAMVRHVTVTFLCSGEGYLFMIFSLLPNMQNRKLQNFVHFSTPCLSVHMSTCRNLKNPFTLMKFDSGSFIEIFNMFQFWLKLDTLSEGLHAFLYASERLCHGSGG